MPAPQHHGSPRATCAEVTVEAAAQLLARAVQPHAHGRFRHAEARSGDGRRLFLEVDERHRGAVRLVEGQDRVGDPASQLFTRCEFIARRNLLQPRPRLFVPLPRRFVAPESAREVADDGAQESLARHFGPSPTAAFLQQRVTDSVFGTLRVAEQPLASVSSWAW